MSRRVAIEDRPEGRTSLRRRSLMMVGAHPRWLRRVLASSMSALSLAKKVLLEPLGQLPHATALTQLQLHPTQLSSPTG
jgi:hypothetical protein